VLSALLSPVKGRGGPHARLMLITGNAPPRARYERLRDEQRTFISLPHSRERFITAADNSTVNSTVTCCTALQQSRTTQSACSTMTLRILVVERRGVSVSAPPL